MCVTSEIFVHLKVSLLQKAKRLISNFVVSFTCACKRSLTAQRLFAGRAEFTSTNWAKLESTRTSLWRGFPSWLWITERARDSSRTHSEIRPLAGCQFLIDSTALKLKAQLALICFAILIGRHRATCVHPSNISPWRRINLARFI